MVKALGKIILGYSCMNLNYCIDMLAKWINKQLPIYIHFKDMKRHNSPSSKGKTLDIIV